MTCVLTCSERLESWVYSLTSCLLSSINLFWQESISKSNWRLLTATSSEAVSDLSLFSLDSVSFLIAPFLSECSDVVQERSAQYSGMNTPMFDAYVCVCCLSVSLSAVSLSPTDSQLID